MIHQSLKHTNITNNTHLYDMDSVSFLLSYDILDTFFAITEV